MTLLKAYLTYKSRLVRQHLLPGVFSNCMTEEINVPDDVEVEVVDVEVYVKHKLLATETTVGAKQVRAKLEDA